MANRLIMENYLLILKSTVEVFVHGTLESSNKDVRGMLKHGLDVIMTSQAETYDKMALYGWYTINNVDSKVITDTLNKLQNKN